MRGNVSVFFIAANILLLGAACGGSDSEKLRVAKLTEGCALNSECEDPLVCAFEHCHRECNEDRDCPTTARCVRNTDGHVCQFDEDTGCTKNSDCRGEQVCGDDGECRDECSKSTDCTKGQLCANSGLCASMDKEKDAVDKDGNILRMTIASSARDAGAADAGGSSDGAKSAGSEVCDDTASMEPDCGGTFTEEVEPNDTKADATPICLGTTVSGDADDLTTDTYVLTTPKYVSGGVVVVILTSGGSGLSLRARNYVEARQLALQNVNAEGNGTIWFTAAPESRFLLDVDKVGPQGRGSYTLATSWTPVEDCREPNNDAMNASPIQVNESVRGFLNGYVAENGNGTAADWYTVELNEGPVTVRLGGVIGVSWPSLTLFDANQDRLAGRSVSGGDTREISAMVTPGRFYVELNWTSGTEVAGKGESPGFLVEPYTLQVMQ